MERCIGIIGEAAGRVSKALQDAHPEVPWKDITGMRHRIIHDYFDVRVDIVWETANNKLPELEKMIRNIINKAEK